MGKGAAEAQEENEATKAEGETGGGEGEIVGEPQEAAPKKKKGKKFDPLSDDPVKFKKIDFEHALTPEEKAAKKAAKKGDKGKKKKVKPPPKEPAEEPPPPEPVQDQPKEKPQPEEEESPEEKPKKGKKGKEKAKKEKPQSTEEDEKPESAEAEKPKKEKKGKGKKGKAKIEEAPTEAVEETPAGKEPEVETIEETEDVTPKGKKGKGKKGKKGPKVETTEDDLGVESETEDAPPKGKKGKGKGKKGKKSPKGETTEEDMGVEPESEEATPKGKKGKGKGKKGKSKDGETKGKKGKGKKGGQPKALAPQISISAFLTRYASKQALGEDEEWTWESYTASSDSIIEPTPRKGKKGKGKGKKGGKKGKKGKKEAVEGEEIPEGGEAPSEGKGGKKKGKGKGKGKKGKKGKKEEGETGVAEEPSEVDIMAEIKKMKEMAEAAARGEDMETVEAPKKKKKGKKKKGEPKKKLTKAEKAKLEEELRIQAEIAAKEAEEAERIRLIEERKAAIEKEKREISEQVIRKEQLNQTLLLIESLKKKKIAKDLEDKEQRQWEEYLKCSHLPDPYVCSQLSKYLYLWDKVMKFTTINDAAARTSEALQLLDLLTTLIDDPVGADQTQIDNWKWLHRLYREHQHESLEAATYKLMRDLDPNFKRINFFESYFRRKENDFSLHVWILNKLPRCLPPRRKPAPVRRNLYFPDTLLNVMLPISLDCKCMALRVTYVKYDHLSDLSESFNKPLTPTLFETDLNQVTLEEWYAKLYYKYENREKELDPPLDEMPEVDREQGIIPIVPYQKLEPTASEFFIAEEDNVYLQIHNDLTTIVDEHVINLRKFVIIGGTYTLDLYYQPPQPHLFVTFDMSLTRLKVPNYLREVPFYTQYEAPPPLDDPAFIEFSPEEIEEEIKKRKRELEEFLLFTINLPDHVMWFDSPFICHWDKEKQVWTDQDIFDLENSEDNSSVTFKTGRFGRFAFAVHRYANLPYQAWDLRPERDGSITLQITAAILQIEFNIKNGLISVSNFEDAPNKSLDGMLGIYYRLPKIKQILKEGGVDVFPDFDAFCYIEGACEKHWPVEQHLYYTMAQLSIRYNFVWSRWNLSAGRRNMVMQMRVYRPEKDSQLPFSTLLVTPLQASYIQCNEESEEYNGETIEGMLFYSDLYNLMKGTTTMMMKSTLQNVSHEQVTAVAELLIATRVLSLA